MRKRRKKKIGDDPFYDVVILWKTPRITSLLADLSCLTQKGPAESGRVIPNVFTWPYPNPCLGYLPFLFKPSLTHPLNIFFFLFYLFSSLVFFNALMEA